MVDLSRRGLLESAGTLGLTAVAGCLDGSDGSGGEGAQTGTTGEDQDTGQPTVTDEQTDTASQDTTGGNSGSFAGIGSLSDALSYLPSPDRIDEFIGPESSIGPDWAIRYVTEDHISENSRIPDEDKMSQMVGQTPTNTVYYDTVVTGDGPRFRISEWPSDVDVEKFASGELEQAGQQSGTTVLEGEMDWYGRQIFNVTGVRGNGTLAADSFESMEDAREAYAKLEDAGNGRESFSSVTSPEMQTLLEEATSRDGDRYDILWSGNNDYNTSRPMAQIDVIGDEEVTKYLLTVNPDGELEEETFTEPIDQYWE